MVPRQRPAKMLRQCGDHPSELGADGLGISTIGEMQQHRVTAGALPRSVPMERASPPRIGSAVWPGTARSSTSAGRSLIIVMSGIRPRPRPSERVVFDRGRRVWWCLRRYMVHSRRNGPRGTRQRCSRFVRLSYQKPKSGLGHCVSTSRTDAGILVAPARTVRPEVVVVEADADAAQIRERLKWTPAQRLSYLKDMIAFERRAQLARRVK